MLVLSACRDQVDQCLGLLDSCLAALLIKPEIFTGFQTHCGKGFRHLEDEVIGILEGCSAASQPFEVPPWVLELTSFTTNFLPGHFVSR